MVCSFSGELPLFEEERWVVRSQTNCCSNLHSFGNDDKLRKYQDVSLKGFSPDNVYILGCDLGFPEMYKQKWDLRIVFIHQDKEADLILNLFATRTMLSKPSCRPCLQNLTLLLKPSLSAGAAALRPCWRWA